jgi:hypothetical protein
MPPHPPTVAAVYSSHAWSKYDLGIYEELQSGFLRKFKGCIFLYPLYLATKLHCHFDTNPRFVKSYMSNQQEKG